MNTKQKLEALRARMIAENIDGFIVPRADEYQNEFPPDGYQRLKWISDFTGSGGVALILMDRAVVLTDGRYLIQVDDEVDLEVFSTGDMTKTSVGAWLSGNTHEDAVIGYDPWLHTPAEIERLEKDTQGRGITLKAVSQNLIDGVWVGRPAIPQTSVTIFPDHVAGKTSQSKRESVMNAIKAKNVQGMMITQQDSIAWLLNVRGADVSCTPLALSYVYVDLDGGLYWFIDPDRVSVEVQDHVGPEVHIVHPDKMREHLQRFSGKAAGLDYKRSPSWFAQVLDTRSVTDPCVSPKACKTLAEQEAIKKSHVLDGIALVRFLYWLNEKGEGKTELDVVQKLEYFRAISPSYRGESFPTIAGFGANGAIIHYRPAAKTNATITSGGVLLLDSGGQYADLDQGIYGTTDITRTIGIGEVGLDIKEQFTRVLKGHIALASAVFPQGSTGGQLDVLARKPLWDVNCDYPHGTGHGVGCYLAVHEDAASFSGRDKTPVEAGMLISNEPGYYRPRQYGIRIENLVLAQGAGTCPDTGKTMLRFETVGYAPIDRSLIVESLLSDQEKTWLNTYHRTVFDLLHVHVEDDVAQWLMHATQPI